MQEQTPFPEPQFIVATSDAEIKIGLEKFGREIAKNPERFKPIVSSIGEMALVGADADTKIDGDLAGTIRHYFLYDHDYDVEYDAETERALRQDHVMTTLISEREEYRADGNREAAAGHMDKIRHRRLAFFVERLIAYRQHSAGDSDLSDAS